MTFIGWKSTGAPGTPNRPVTCASRAPCALVRGGRSSLRPSASARFAAAEALGRGLDFPPLTSAHGALLAHVTGRLGVPGAQVDFQPMNVNFGLFPPIEEPVIGDDGKRLRGKEKTFARKRALSRRALRDFDAWLGEAALLAA